MKKIITLLLLTFLAISCSDKSIDDLIKENDVKAMQERKITLQKELDERNSQMAKLNEALEKLNPNATFQSVQTLVMQPKVFSHYIDIQANVTTDKDVMVYPEFAGILRLNVAEGQAVGAGQIIATISDGGLKQQYSQIQSQTNAVRAQMQQAQAQADLARITYEKQTKLWNQKIGSEIQYLQAKTAYEASMKQVAAANSQIAATQNAAQAMQQMIAKTNVRAPFSGIVDKVITQNGQAISPGVPIIRLVNLGNMKVEANVPESYLPSVKSNTPVIIDLPSVGVTLNSKVNRVTNFINPSNRTFTATILIPSHPLVKPNLIAKVKINDYINPNAFIIPSEAIRKDANGNTFVFLLQANNIAKRTFVVTGKTSSEGTEILKGIAINDIVITQGYQKLVDGEKVKK